MLCPAANRRAMYYAKFNDACRAFDRDPSTRTRDAMDAARRTYDASWEDDGEAHAVGCDCDGVSS